MLTLTQTDHVRHLTREQRETVREMCRWSARLFDKVIVMATTHLTTFPDEPLTYAQSYRMLRDDEAYRMLEAGVAQQTMRAAHAAMATYVSLRAKVERNEYPRELLSLPRPKGEGALYPLTIPVNVVSIRHGNLLRLPVSRPFRKAHPGMSNVLMTVAPHVAGADVRQARVRMLPVTGEVWLDVTYRADDPDPADGMVHVMGMDLGVNNAIAAVTTAGTALLVDGRRLKSANHRYNGRMAEARRDVVASTGRLAETKAIAYATQRRDCRIRDAYHKAAAAVTRHCVEHDVGVVVCGHTRRLEPRTPPWARNFAELPLGRLVEALESACAKRGLTFVEQEDAYVSRASFMDGDPAPNGDVPDDGNLSFSGRRTHRGLYRTSDGLLVNADLNAAANVLAKMARQNHQSLDLDALAEALLSEPEIVRL